MIAFSCSRCGSELEASNTEAGKKVACPDCGRSLVVPSSRPGKKSSPAPARDTRLTGPSSRRMAPKPPPVEEDEDLDDLDDEEADTSKSGSGLLWIMLGLGGGLALLGVVAVVAVVVFVFVLPGRTTQVADNTTPSSTNPPPTIQPQTSTPIAPQPAPSEPRPPALPPLGGSPVGTSPEPTPPGGSPVVKPPEPAPEEPAVAVQPGSGGGQKVYQYLLHSTALMVHLIRLPTGEVGMGMGTGGVVDRTNRLLVTNYHVVGNADRIYVFFPAYKDGKMIAERDYFLQQAKKEDALVGRVLYKDARVDLAIVQVDRLPDNIQALPFAASRPTPGQPVYSVGHPGRSGGLWVYTEGKVRQLLHKKWSASDSGGTEVINCDAEVVLTDSPTNPGDSGGPLVNSRGEVVAVVHGSDTAARLVSLFIDVTEVKAILDRYAQTSGMKLALATGSTLGAEEDADNLPGLLRSLENKDPAVRARAARSLGELGANGKLAVAPLLKALNDKDDLVPRLALEALNKIGAPDRNDASLLVAALKDTNVEARHYAADALGKMGAEVRSTAVPALLDALKDRQDTALRQAAARSLGKMGPDAKAQVQPVLLQTLNDEDADVRGAAAAGLASLPLTPADVTPLTGLLKHKDSEVRQHAAEALGQIGPEARTALKPLAETLQDSSSRVRQASLEALAHLGPDAKEVLPDIEKALKDSDKDVRKAALTALGGLGAEAKGAARALAETLTDPDLRKGALAALVKIGPPASHDAASSVAALLSVGEKEDRLQVLAALAALKPAGTETRDVIAKVIALFDDTDVQVRDKAAETLARMGKPAVPALKNALGDLNKEVRLRAANALGEIGPSARDAAPILNLHYTGDADPEVRQACLKALSKMQR